MLQWRHCKQKNPLMSVKFLCLISDAILTLTLRLLYGRWVSQETIIFETKYNTQVINKIFNLLTLTRYGVQLYKIDSQI